MKKADLHGMLLLSAVIAPGSRLNTTDVSASPLGVKICKIFAKGPYMLV
jgi:hypothetical protein